MFSTLFLGADIYSVTQDGDSALYLATYAVLNSRQPDISILDLLIAHGILPSINFYSWYLLNLAKSVYSDQVL